MPHSGRTKVGRRYKSTPGHTKPVAVPPSTPAQRTPVKPAPKPMAILAQAGSTVPKPGQTTGKPNQGKRTPVKAKRRGR